MVAPRMHPAGNRRAFTDCLGRIKSKRSFHISVIVRETSINFQLPLCSWHLRAKYCTISVRSMRILNHTVVKILKRYRIATDEQLQPLLDEAERSGRSLHS